MTETGKKSPKKAKSVESLRAFAVSKENFAEKFDTMKLWFDLKFAVDHRAEVIQSIRDIVLVDIDRLEGMNIGQLINIETKLVQYSMTLGELCADHTGKFNFSYVYRKFQYSGNWSGTRDSVFKAGSKITNGELDNISEMSVFEERCISTFFQERVDIYKNILTSCNQYIKTIQSRIAESRRQLSLREDPRIYGKQ